MKSPLTHNSNCELLDILDPNTIAGRWRNELGVEVGNTFRELEKIEYWRCLTTGLRWYAPNESAGQGSLYEQLERFDWYYIPGKWEFHKALEYIKKGADILEVGAGSGHFLDAAKAKGMTSIGLELNASAAARVRSKGFNVFEIKLMDLAASLAKPFDAVCAFQVLEHVPEPRRLLDDMIAVLKPGGKLILSVPNAAVMRVIEPKQGGLLDSPPHHMTHWDEGVFRALESLLPVRLVAAHREPLATYHIHWFVSGYTKFLRRRYGKTIGRILLNRITIPLIRWLLRRGIRYLFPGHTLLVVFERTA